MVLNNNKNRRCPGLYHLVQAGDGGLCRIRLEQGCITPAQLRLLASLSRLHGNGVIELTSRANVQLRGITPDRITDLVSALELSGLAPKVRQGDGVRNVMVNPTAGFDPQGDDRMMALAREISCHLQTNLRAQTLSPKFSIFLDGGEDCALIHHIHDIWLSLCDEGKNFAFGIASRPPLANEPSLPLPPTLAKVPFWGAKHLIFTLIDLLLDWRDHQAEIERMKHVVARHDGASILALLKQKLPFIVTGEAFYRLPPKAYAYLGIHPTKNSQRFYLGVKPPLGRLTPDQADFVADAACSNKDSCLRLTPWQSLILFNGRRDWCEEQEHLFRQAGFVTHKSQALARISCCVGAPSCLSAKAHVRADALKLAEQLEGEVFHPIHLTGCTKSCAASEARATTLVAVAEGRYDLFRAETDASSPAFGRCLSRHISLEQFLAMRERTSNESADHDF